MFPYFIDLKQELNVKTRYTSPNGTQQQNGLSPGSEITTPNGINGDIMSHAETTATTASANNTAMLLNNTNNTTNSTATTANINDYQLQQRSLKSKISRSLKKTKGVLKLTKKFRNRD